MTASPMTLLEGGLVFDRSGQTLIATEPEAISIIELDAGGQTRRLPIRDARAVAAFDDQLWIATHDNELVRIDHAGRALGPPCSLPFAIRAVLDPAPCGPAAAIWSSTPAVAWIDEGGRLAEVELADVEIALPLTGRRFVTAQGAKLTLPSGHTVMLAPGTVVLGGAVMSDGKSVTLLVAHGGERHLIVVSLGTGRIKQRCPTPSSTIRLASRKSLALALLEPRVIRILDLRAGCELATVDFHDDIDDFAIDPDGQTLAVRCGNGSIELQPVADLLGPMSSDIGAAGARRSAANRFDVSDTETPTLNIRRPRSRLGSRPAAGGLTLVPRLEDPVSVQPGDSLGQLVSDARRAWSIASGTWAIESRNGNSGTDLSVRVIAGQPDESRFDRGPKLVENVEGKT